jgi:hypothetical protein
MDYLAREGARKMLTEALEEEVTMYLVSARKPAVREEVIPFEGRIS